ncbi:MAG: glycosyltransferase [Propioniciclava sp.]
MSEETQPSLSSKHTETLPLALWVVPVASLGGVARHVIDVAKAGIPGWRLAVLCPEGPLVHELQTSKVAVFPVKFGPEAGLLRSVETLARYRHKLQPRVVHTHLAYADIVAALAVRPRVTQLFSTEHGITPLDTLYHGSTTKSKAMRFVHTLRARRFTRHLAVCRSTRDVMQERWRLRHPAHVIYNGVNTVENSSASPSDGLHIVSISRLAAEKRIPQLLEAFAILRRQGADARLTIAGTGPERDTIVATVAALGLENHVALPGHVAAEGLLAGADVLVQLSAWENCSYSVLDACANQVGVVATPVGGNPEILPARCLVDPDKPDLVAARILDQAQPTNRPGLPAGWPTVAGMTAQIAQLYQEVV